MWFGSSNATSNLAFVFCPGELMSGRIPSLNGTNNLYYAQYKKLDQKYIDLAGFRSFTSSVGYVYLIFSLISHIRTDIDQMLFRAGTSQGDCAYIKTFLPPDCWSYIRLFLQDLASSVEVRQVP